MVKKIDTETLVSEYLARGGKITKCPTRVVASNDNRKIFRIAHPKQEAFWNSLAA
jgi:hypothetical protein